VIVAAARKAVNAAHVAVVAYIKADRLDNMGILFLEYGLARIVQKSFLFQLVKFGKNFVSCFYGNFLIAFSFRVGKNSVFVLGTQKSDAIHAVQAAAFYIPNKVIIIVFVSMLKKVQHYSFSVLTAVLIFSSFLQVWFPTVQLVLQADWQLDWHSPQPVA